MFVVGQGTPRAGLIISPLNEIKILIMGDFMYLYFFYIFQAKDGGPDSSCPRCPCIIRRLSPKAHTEISKDLTPEELGNQPRKGPSSH